MNEQENVKPKKKKKKIYKLTIVFAILDFFALICFVVVYFIPGVRSRVITTALNTMTHQYLAHVFYSDKMIQDVLDSNYYIPVNEEVDLDQIVIDNSEKERYDSEYEEAILKRDPGNNDYKIIDVRVGNNNNKGYLIAIYDPSRVKLITKEALGVGTYERTIDMCARYNGLVCINGGGFMERDGYGIDVPTGYVVKDGQIIWNSGYNPNAHLIAMTYDNKLLLTVDSAENAIANSNVRDAVEFSPPFLIVNGKPAEIVGDGGWGYSSRVAIAQRKDGIILFLVVDGSALYIDGASLSDMIELLLLYGAHNAANLDGGNSTTLIVEGKTHNKLMPNAAQYGGRYVVNGWALLPK